MKVFNSYVQFCNLAYWGPSEGPAQPKMNLNKKSADPSSKNLQNGDAILNADASPLNHSTGPISGSGGGSSSII